MTEPEVVDSRPATSEHISQVRGLLLGVAGDLVSRGHRHDASKLVEPERATFDRVTTRLRSLTHGSEEYEEARKGMGPALDHHYEVNDHHPEHFGDNKEHGVTVDVGTEHLPGGEITVATATCDSCDWLERGDEDDVRDAAAAHERETFVPGGIHAMNLLQLTEMLCDWIAATRRHDDGDIRRSIDESAARFGYGEELRQLLHNSVDAIIALEVQLASPGDPAAASS
jgi:hypothetical protein